MKERNKEGKKRGRKKENDYFICRESIKGIVNRYVCATTILIT